ncbi:tyrosine-type recombinase/integrase [Delftia sp. PS-11]|uniref:tyrosine-type recombinase/integrase n=1 Tax=Delftia sp. PS-11 TaxID=2767222 RepID=UPI0024549E77|nr:tyrosine-type recombinase/integrase [Delftia sp. PS-11]KAJ8744705.1 tyrosine-type recombinase/integrase [Delftia sp. PS-11]
MRRLPRAVLTAGEMETVLSLADTTTPLGLRDRALMELLYSSGLRRMEAANLELGDIDPQRKVVLIREGKGRKDRLLPVSERALYWLQEYLTRARPQLAWDLREKGVFLAHDGTPIGMSWVSGSVNYAQYQSSLAAGLEPAQSALNTWTGKLAQSYGYGQVESITGSNSNVYVLFRKPGSGR